MKAVAKNLDETARWLIAMALRDKARKDAKIAEEVNSLDRRLAGELVQQAQQALDLAEAFEGCESAMLIVDEG